MTLWRYKAISMAGASGTTLSPQQGELSGESPADVRAALRRIGLQVIDLQPMSRPSSSWLHSFKWLQSGIELWQIHLRKRRQPQRAELYDSLATMLQSGLPLLEAFDTIIESTSAPHKHRDRRRQRHAWVALAVGRRMMLVHCRDALRSGSSLAQAMGEHPTWFDQPEVAMVNAGQHGGMLPDVLRSLAERHQHSGELSGKLVSALAYPAIVTLVGIGVTVFLSVKTLPDLAAILTSAKVKIPPLTAGVMSVGGFIASHWLLILSAVPLVLFGLLVTLRRLAQRGTRQSGRPARWKVGGPKLMRRLAVARFAHQLSQLLQSGVPMVDSLRVLAPTSGGLTGDFSNALLLAADRIERGDELSSALDDTRWFDAEFRRLLEVGQASGELDELLRRIAERYERQTRRLIDRLASLMEPAVILLLAVLVGIVVMAAILPLLKLREIL